MKYCCLRDLLFGLERRRLPVAQFVAREFADRRPRQFIDEIQRRRNFVLAELVQRQRAIRHAAVGAAMSRSSAVRLEDGVLLVEAQTSQWAAAIMRASPMILSRLRGTLGPDAVREIRLRR